MSEKMLVTQALDERDLLVKKLKDKIAQIRLVDTKRVNEEKTNGQRVTSDEFAAAATSAYQQITDYIDRYQRLDAAIVASNASHFVETSHGRFSVAGAIALRARLKGEGIYDADGAFEKALQVQFETQMNTALREADMQTLTDRQREVIDLYYGDEGVTDSDVARWLGLARTTVNQARLDAEKRIRAYCMRN